MNIRAGLGEYILQTHNTNFFEDSIKGFEPPNSPSRYASERDAFSEHHTTGNWGGSLPFGRSYSWGSQALLLTCCYYSCDCCSSCLLQRLVSNQSSTGTPGSALHGRYTCAAASGHADVWHAWMKAAAGLFTKCVSMYNNTIIIISQE